MQQERRRKNFATHIRADESMAVSSMVLSLAQFQLWHS